jgi:hypothetical protein
MNVIAIAFARVCGHTHICETSPNPITSVTSQIASTIRGLAVIGNDYSDHMPHGNLIDYQRGQGRNHVTVTCDGLSHGIGDSTANHLLTCATVAPRTVLAMETGRRWAGREDPSERDWLRYRRLCAGLAAAPDFDW